MRRRARTAFHFSLFTALLSALFTALTNWILAVGVRRRKKQVSLIVVVRDKQITTTPASCRAAVVWSMVLNMNMLTVLSTVAFFSHSFALEAHVRLQEECYTPPLPNSVCGFYIGCLENYYPCGEEGYAIGYGYKYCQKFTDEETRNCMDNSGNEWINSTLLCLQQALVPIIESDDINDMSCRSIKLDAFDSHSTCYTGGGGSTPSAPSVCFLPPSDVKCILSTIDTKDLVSPLGLKEDIETAKICVTQHESTSFCKDSVDDSRHQICAYWREIVNSNMGTHSMNQ